MEDAPLPLAGLLRDLGFDSPAAQDLARAALVSAKLTTPSKQNISADKRARVEQTLAGQFLVSCGAADCSRGSSDRTVVIALDRARCWSCEGSDTRRAMDKTAALFRERGIHKLVVVGGSPAVHERLRALAPAEWELRIVEGTERHTAPEARGNLKWADVVLIWGSSELDHKVSEHYTGGGGRSEQVVRLSRRGIAALLEAAQRWAEHRPRE